MTRGAKRTYFYKSRARTKAGAARLRFIVCFVLLMLLPLTYLLQYLARRNPASVEYVYSRGIYPVISRLVSGYFHIFPFSAAEILVYTLIVFIIFLIVQAIIYLCRRQIKPLVSLLLTAACFFTTGFFLFTAMWGLNYYRQPLAQNLGYKTGNPSAAELSAMMKNETDAVNSLCSHVSFYKNLCSYYTGGFGKIKAQMNAGYQALAAQGELQNRLFGGNRPYPKAILASKLMSYTGIEGIFFPFTYEPNVNTNSPSFVLPFDAAHESAHFKGFAREEEANFIAYLADSANPDPYFRYSAHIEAYIYISNALYETDNATWQKISVKLDKRAVGDLQYYNQFIVAHQSTAQNISTKVNDSYLKSQGQRGVISYDMFVNLLADKYRTENK
jgi:hypothetical protein